MSSNFTTSYIDRAQPFAQPILSHIRTLVLAANPEIVEAKKWSVPAFTYKGTIVCMMGAFKSHATLGFWYGKLVTGGTGVEDAAMGSFGRITSLADLPSDADLARFVTNSCDLIDRGIKPPQFEAKAKPPKAAIETPDGLVNALADNEAAAQVWAGFPPGAQREYCEWIVEAKRQETRDKRTAQAIEWIADGKKRNWKYEVC